jgi:hypothetical protein
MGSRELPGQLVYVDTAIGRISPTARSFVGSSDESHDDEQHEPVDSDGVLDDDGAISSDDEAIWSDDGGMSSDDGADASAASASIYEFVQTTMGSESDPPLISPRRAPPPPSVTTTSLSTIYPEPISVPTPSKRKLFGLKTDGTRTGNRCRRIFKLSSTYSLIRHGRIQLV